MVPSTLVVVVFSGPAAEAGGVLEAAGTVVPTPMTRLDGDTEQLQMTMPTATNSPAITLPPSTGTSVYWWNCQLCGRVVRHGGH